MSEPEHATPRPRLGLIDAVSLAVGIVVGVSIFKVPARVFHSVESAWVGMGVWLAGGALSLIGALCFAEMAAAYPRAGGQYAYLSRAYGRGVGFLFGWAQLAVVITGTIGAMAYVFADYAVALLGISTEYAAILAMMAVAGLTAINLLGVVVGKTAQNVLTIAKLTGLAGIVAAGLLSRASPAAPSAPAATPGAGIGLALIFVLYAYGGWSDVAYVAAETRRRRRNIPWALFLGVGAVTVAYLAVNAAYLACLGMDGLRVSTIPAAHVLTVALGPFGGKAMSVLVMVSALGAINGMIFAGARVYAAMGKEHRLFSLLARWNQRLTAPTWSLVVQGAIALALVIVVGTSTGRGTVDGVLGTFRLTRLRWDEYGGGFETLVTATAPVFWGFFLLTGAALIVLRVREPGHRRPFRVPLYPLPPLIFCATSMYMLYAAISYAGALALLGVLPVLAGIPLYRVSRMSGFPRQSR